MKEMNSKQSMQILAMICRLHRNHESFMESYPEDVKSPEGRRYAVNNIIKETQTLLSDLSHLLIVEKEIDEEMAEDTFMMILTNATDLMDKYTNRGYDYYENAIEELIQKVGDM